VIGVRSCEVDADPYPLRECADRGLRRDPGPPRGGIWLPGSYWGRLWIWVLLILLIDVGIAMTPLAAGPMRRVRRALGMQKASPGRANPCRCRLPTPTAGARAALKPELTAVIGVAALVVIIWMMVAKPF
jgi:hypothetical protein